MYAHVSKPMIVKYGKIISSNWRIDVIIAILHDFATIARLDKTKNKYAPKDLKYLKKKLNPSKK